ncbi:helix-turn-helix transcriptional regulator [Leucobacter sp. OH1287]|uniref:helix-turn-helix domain-containing protein n=1 Tax=Leucobacter sp. OH1287 TaxID=2491049 RepID=UPI000F5F4D03|nr:hypothetical protein EII30_02840 [Leucobacter sp. OH1287]
MTISNRVSRNIKTRCEQASIPITKLSQETGIPDKTLRRRQADPDQYSLRELIRISRVLDVEVGDLIVKDL